MLQINIVNSYSECLGRIGTYQIDNTSLNLSLIISAKVYKEKDLDLAVQHGLITEAMKQSYIDISTDFIDGNIELEVVRTFPLTEIPATVGLYYEQSVEYLTRLLLCYKTHGDVDMITIKEWFGEVEYTSQPTTIDEILQIYADAGKKILISYY